MRLRFGENVGAFRDDRNRRARRQARSQRCDVLILDTAGRLHINDELMGELRSVNEAVGPHQILLVIDAMTGQIVAALDAAQTSGGVMGFRRPSQNAPGNRADAIAQPC